MKYADMKNYISNMESFTANNAVIISNARTIRVKQELLKEENAKSDEKDQSVIDSLTLEIGKLSAKLESCMKENQSVIDKVYTDVLFDGKTSTQEVMKGYFADMFRPYLSVKAKYDKKTKSATVSLSYEGDKDVLCYPFSDVLALCAEHEFETETIMNLFEDSMVSVYAYAIDKMAYDGQAKSTLVNKWEERYGTDGFSKKCTTGSVERAMQDVVNALFGLTEEQRQTIHFTKGMVNRYLFFDGTNSRDNRNGNMVFADKASYVKNWNWVLYECYTGNSFDVMFK